MQKLVLDDLSMALSYPFSPQGTSHSYSLARQLAGLL